MESVDSVVSVSSSDDVGELKKPVSENASDSCYSYEGETYVYTDSATGYQYKWDISENKWVPKVERPVAAAEDSKYEIVGNTYVYKDEDGRLLEWDVAANEWKLKVDNKKKILKRGSDEEFNTSDESEDEQILIRKKETINHNVVIGSDGVRTYKDPTDGTVFEWDEEKKAWFPKLDEEFLARYQMSYGMENEANKEAVEKVEPKVVEPKQPKKPSEPNWFEIDDAHNNKVYVSNLPTDISEKEFVDFMQKCGLIERDLQTSKMKIKIYTDSEGKMKGDALCTYIKVESVELALNLLDGSVLGGKTIRVERAKFTLKGEYDPTKKPRKRKKKEAEKLRKKQEKLFDWRPDQLRGERGKNENVVVLKRLFKPIEFDENPAQLLEYQTDLREECSKFGHVRKVTIHDRNEEGAAQIFFKTAEEADKCVEMLHGRWFAGHKITAETWDGVTKYRKEESEAEKQERLDKWAEFLRQEEERDKKPDDGDDQD